MKNLLTETKKILEENNKTFNDIIFVSKWDGCIPLDLLTEVFDIMYDNGYGGVEVDPTLIICGKGWWLERAEYDGAEWWEYKEQPQKPSRLAVSYHVIN